MQNSIIFKVNRLERILRDVLVFSRAPKANIEPQGINEVVKESIKAFSDVCNKQSIQIEENLDESLLSILIARDQIREAVNDLISNAVDAMPTGGCSGSGH